MARTVAEVLIERLVDWGVDTIFGLPGDGINGLFEALRTSAERIRFIQVRHEEAAAFAACAYAKFSGRLGVCIATSGPGGIHPRRASDRGGRPGCAAQSTSGQRGRAVRRDCRRCLSVPVHSIPFQLCTFEFFRELERHMTPGGTVVVNVGRDRDGRDVVEAVAATLAAVLPVVRAADVPDWTNTILVGTRHPPTRDAGTATLGLPMDVTAALAALPEPHLWRPGSPVSLLTDDRAPVEWLTDGIILRRLVAILRQDGRTGP